MKCTRVSDSYDLYRLEVSFAELGALRSKLAGEETGVISDELLQALDWYVTNLPKPGEDPKAKKKEDDGTQEDELPAPYDGDQEKASSAIGPESTAEPTEKTDLSQAANELEAAAAGVGDEELPPSE